MNKKLLCAALLGSLGLAQAASAQEFDDRWYVSGSTGVNLQDHDRGTEDAIFGTIGFGKFLTPNVSLDTELNYQNPRKNINQNLRWSQYGISLDARYHFRNADSKFWPYVRGGIGVQRHEEEYDASPLPNPGRHKATNTAVNLGVGMQLNKGRLNVRAEVGSRIDFDSEQARIGDQQSLFTDVLTSIGLTYALGPDPVAPVAPAPAPEPAKTCADMDDDGDGVNNCNDKCPNSQPGQTIGPDGCPVPVSIDLK
ncbi:MAG: porin family protein, partial [Thermomonas sp.]